MVMIMLAVIIASEVSETIDTTKEGVHKTNTVKVAGPVFSIFVEKWRVAHFGPLLSCLRATRVPEH